MKSGDRGWQIEEAAAVSDEAKRNNHQRIPGTKEQTQLGSGPCLSIEDRRRDGMTRASSCCLTRRSVKRAKGKSRAQIGSSQVGQLGSMG